MKMASWLMLALGVVLFVAGTAWWLSDKRNQPYKVEILAMAIIPGCTLCAMGWAGMCALSGREDRSPTAIGAR